jgi:hypothetical protein
MYITMKATCTILPNLELLKFVASIPNWQLDEGKRDKLFDCPYTLLKPYQLSI